MSVLDDNIGRKVTRVDGEREHGQSNHVKEIMNINIMIHKKSEQLSINPAIDCGVPRNMYDEISKMDIEPVPVDYELNIRLKHERPIGFRPRRLEFYVREKLRK